MLDKNIVSVKVSGDIACFTRPDMKVERFSYPCITSSSARGILDSILWKPEFRWYIRKVKILKPIKYISVKRNEIKNKQDIKPINRENNATPRNSTILKDVEYVIEASIYQKNEDKNNPPKKYIEMFKRRVKKGQCYRRPFLGTRECSCEFMPVSGDEKAINDIIPIGSMFFDMYYYKDDKKNITAKPIYLQNVVIKNGEINFDCDENKDFVEHSLYLKNDNGEEFQNILLDYAKIEKEELNND